MRCKIKDISINYEVIGEGKPVVMTHVAIIQTIG